MTRDQTLAERRIVPTVFMMDLWATVPYYTAYLCRALRQAGVPVQVGSMSYYLDPGCFASRGLKTSPGCLDVVGRVRLPRLLRRIGKLSEGLLNLLALTLRFSVKPPDVLHVQFLPLLRSRLPLDLWFVRFCQRRGIAVVLTVHDLMPHDTGETHRALYRELYSKMHALICHSAHIRASLEADFGIPAEKITVIPHGPFFFDVPDDDSQSTFEALGVQNGQKLVLWQGIIFPYKGVDLLLDSWQEIGRRAPNLCLVVLGTGDPSLLADLETRAKTLGLKNVRFHFRFCTAQELVAAYRAADVVVYPYRAITTSGALATGLSLGKAIVASRLPVFQELLRDGENALLADPADPVQMADAILRVTSDRELRSRLERAVGAMQFSERSWQEIARDTLQVYVRAAAQVAEGAKR